MTQPILQTNHPDRNSRIRHNRRNPCAPFSGTPTESEREIFHTPTNRSKGETIVPDFQTYDFSVFFRPATGTGHRICLRGKTAIPGDVYKNAAFSMPDRLNCAERHKENVTPIPRMILLIRKRVFYD